MTIQANIKDIVTNNAIVLFMKGSADFPQCGFSARAVQILQNLGAEFTDINVLEDDDIRQGVKDYAQWPTIPQLYINGEFMGGCDIMVEMFDDGELKKALAKA